ncbi:MAG TPA: porin [Marinobacter sp.]|nr:porin [Marinobacter sp.]
MKKQLLALAIGSMVVAPSMALAEKGPIVYGKANVSYENQDDGDNDSWNLESNASRLGVKGEIDLDVQDLVAVYQAEFEISVDDGDKDGETFSQRNIFGGFKHKRLGTLIAGKFDTPFKNSQSEIDQFGDLRGDIKYILSGQERENNIIQYSTPKLADAITLNVAMIPGEEKDEPGEYKYDEPRDSAADAFSTSLVFDNGMVYASAGYDSEVETKLYDMGGDTNALVDAWHVAGKVTIQNFEVGALYQLSENSDSKNEGGIDYEDSTYIVSGAVNLNRWKLKAQYGLTDMDTTDDELSLWAVGADYKIGKSSKVYGYYAAVETDEGTETITKDDSTFGIGFEHKFSM